MKPRIALTIGPQDTQRQQLARQRYVDALERAGAEVVIVPPGARLDRYDAVCLSGGGDVDPAAYGEPRDPATADVVPERDRTEIELARTAVARDVPVLAICRGFQVLNVALGGSLLQDVAGHRVDAPIVEHVVAAAPGSLLASAVGSAPFRVNSRHHQGVTTERLAPGLVATAQLGGLVEAFESTSRRFVVGVQWHPERVGIDAELDSAPARALFDAFVATASRQPAPAG